VKKLCFSVTLFVCLFVYERCYFALLNLAPFSIWVVVVSRCLPHPRGVYKNRSVTVEGLVIVQSLLFQFELLAWFDETKSVLEISDLVLGPAPFSFWVLLSSSPYKP
jgi:hypothetical protein